MILHKRYTLNQLLVSSDYQLAESEGLELDYGDEHTDFRKTTFPARYIYERLLPSVVEKFSDIHYHRSSPYSGYGKRTTDKSFGDLHQCMPRCYPHRVHMSVTEQLQGTSGMVLKSPGKTGTS